MDTIALKSPLRWSPYFSTIYSIVFKREISEIDRMSVGIDNYIRCETPQISELISELHPGQWTGRGGDTPRPEIIRNLFGLGKVHKTDFISD